MLSWYQLDFLNGTIEKSSAAERQDSIWDRERQDTERQDRVILRYLSLSRDQAHSGKCFGFDSNSDFVQTTAAFLTVLFNSETQYDHSYSALLDRTTTLRHHLFWATGSLSCMWFELFILVVMQCIYSNYFFNAYQVQQVPFCSCDGLAIMIVPCSSWLWLLLCCLRIFAFSLITGSVSHTCVCVCRVTWKPVKMLHIVQKHLDLIAIARISANLTLCWIAYYVQQLDISTWIYPDRVPNRHQQLISVRVCVHSEGFYTRQMPQANAIHLFQAMHQCFIAM